MEKPINTEEELRAVLEGITFVPSCLDMGWQWSVETLRTEELDIDLRSIHLRGWLVSTTFQRPDTNTGVVGRGEGRKWFIAKGTSESGVVKTCYAAAKMIVEHELMEAYRYKGHRIFDPHHTVEQLSNIK